MERKIVVIIGFWLGVSGYLTYEALSARYLMTGLLFWIIFCCGCVYAYRVGLVKIKFR